MASETISTAIASSLGDENTTASNIVPEEAKVADDKSFDSHQGDHDDAFKKHCEEIAMYLTQEQYSGFQSFIEKQYREFRADSVNVGDSNKKETKRYDEFSDDTYYMNARIYFQEQVLEKAEYVSLRASCDAMGPTKH